MYLCPGCGREMGETAVCKCGVDLRLLQQLIARGDHLFNEALTAVQSNQVAAALARLEMNAALAPFDVEARLLQAQLLAQQENWAEAATLVQQVQALAPAHPGLAPLLAVLAGASQVAEAEMGDSRGQK